MNVAALLDEQISLHKTKTAVIHKNESLTFTELGQSIDSFAHYLKSLSINPGDKVLVFVKPGLYFPALVYALFKIEAVVVLMDPGMGLRNLKRSIKQVAPDFLISIPAVHFGSILMRSSFLTIKKKICFTKSRAKKLSRFSGHSFKTPNTADDNFAAILFTSGGTGAPKGVLYPHRIFVSQTHLLKKLFSLHSDQIDFPGFPLFALFTLAMGMTIVVPQMDASKPAKCDPEKLVKDILKHHCTFLAGSPSIWDRVASYCHDQNIVLNSVKYIVMFGAPVSTNLHTRLKKIIPNGETYAPYGATESLPVCCFSGSEVLAAHEKNKIGQGVCLGRVDQGPSEIKIIQIDDSILRWDELRFEKPGVVGEILVSSETTTPGYYQLDEKTKEAKIFQSGKIWHRMGDVGQIDSEGLLWFCGRKGHRVKTSNGLLFSIPCESYFEEHEAIKKSALVQLEKNGIYYPGLVVERKDRSTIMTDQFKSELKIIAKNNQMTSLIDSFFLHPSLPVDGRHNIKIDRLALSSWAQEQLP